MPDLSGWVRKNPRLRTRLRTHLRRTIHGSVLTTGPPAPVGASSCQSSSCLPDTAAGHPLGKRSRWERGGGRDSETCVKNKVGKQACTAAFQVRTQPACYCHRGFQPHSRSCTLVVTDEQHLIGKLLFYFSLWHLQPITRNVTEGLGSLERNNKEQIVIRFAFFILSISNQLPNAAFPTLLLGYGLKGIRI